MQLPNPPILVLSLHSGLSTSSFLSNKQGQILLSFPVTSVCSYFIDLCEFMTSSYPVEQEEKTASCKLCENIIHRETEH